MVQLQTRREFYAESVISSDMGRKENEGLSHCQNTKYTDLSANTASANRPRYYSPAVNVNKSRETSHCERQVGQEEEAELFPYLADSTGIHDEMSQRFSFDSRSSLFHPSQ
jgi:hypothetical protein